LRGVDLARRKARPRSPHPLVQNSCGRFELSRAPATLGNGLLNTFGSTTAFASTTRRTKPWTSKVGQSCERPRRTTNQRAFPRSLAAGRIRIAEITDFGDAKSPHAKSSTRGLPQSQAATMARRASKMRLLLSSRRISPVVFIRTHDTRTPYAVDVTGGGRNSASSRGIAANRFLTIAASATRRPT
jgi:hypothetical protein